MGLVLHLSEPTALSAVTIDVSSTGTQVQIRSSPTEAPAKLADTVELTPTTLFSDNKSAIELTKDHMYHARTKHIDIRYHFIRYTVEEGSIRIVFCPTEDMVADALTKALPSAKAKHFASQFGLVLP